MKKWISPRIITLSSEQLTFHMQAHARSLHCERYYIR